MRLRVPSLICLFLFGSAFTRPAAAQPQTDAQAWSALQKNTAPLQKSDPAAAIAQYKAFFESRPNLDTATAISIAATIAQLQFQGLKDAPSALATYSPPISGRWASMASIPTAQSCWRATRRPSTPSSARRKRRS